VGLIIVVDDRGGRALMCIWRRQLMALFMPFYRRRAESGGDEHDDWGGAVYYLWV
jgi:hypothetical protein